MPNPTFRLSEDELLKLGFSRVAARALRYVFESVGAGTTPDATLIEINDLVGDMMAQTDSSKISTLQKRIEDLEKTIPQPETTKIAILEKRITDLEEMIWTLVDSSNVSVLSKRISDLERFLVL